MNFKNVKETTDEYQKIALLGTLTIVKLVMNMKSA